MRCLSKGVLRGESRALQLVLLLAINVGSSACGGLKDEERLVEPGIGTAGPRPQAFLNFPPESFFPPRADEPEVPGFPLLLSETGAFADLSRLEPSSGIVPYELQAPLWSDGASKRRWMSLPELGAITAAEDEAWRFPEGTIFVKHFEIALDESQPDVRHRLETRLLIAARGGSYYGVTYKWNPAQTDAELVTISETELLSIVDADGQPRDQQYFYPGPRDCFTCHTSNAGYVLGPRTRQLNLEFEYRADSSPINQLVAWSGWQFLDRTFDNTQAYGSPRLANISDDAEGLEHRVRSYWDGNCSMCHMGSAGSISGWGARIITPIEEQGLLKPPQSPRTDLPFLITPGDPEHSYIYVRGESVEGSVRMPPIGRNRVDTSYVEVLAQWIDSLE
jgi:uncharacterized repeat protein (TIGR03806 family)